MCTLKYSAGGTLICRSVLCEWTGDRRRRSIHAGHLYRNRTQRFSLICNLGSRPKITLLMIKILFCQKRKRFFFCSSVSYLVISFEGFGAWGLAEKDIVKPQKPHGTTGNLEPQRSIFAHQMRPGCCVLSCVCTGGMRSAVGNPFCVKSLESLCTALCVCGSWACVRVRVYVCLHPNKHM